ncbi:hypothetical protein, partial [Devosia sp. LjRoot3]|uniref:hypothetical protein n=1 Tax=Devosia sp. LjRoot3 TaxID=3342319 RepID=UPI003F4F9BA4
MALFVVALVFCFYSLGANAVEGLINYPSWKLIPEASFRAYHKHLDRSVPIWVVLPTLVYTVATALLIFLGPDGLPKPLVVTALVLQLVGWATSLAIAIPIQISLSKNGWSATKVARLMLTDRLFRQLPALLSACIYVALLWRLL